MTSGVDVRRVLTSRRSRSNRRPKDAPPPTRAQLHHPSHRMATCRHPLPSPRRQETKRRRRRLLASAPPRGGSPGGERPWPAALCPASPANMTVCFQCTVTSVKCVLCACRHVINLLLCLCVVVLCKNISTSLPQQERLDKLIEASMKVSVYNHRVLSKIFFKAVL